MLSDSAYFLFNRQTQAAFIEGQVVEFQIIIRFEGRGEKTELDFLDGLYEHGAVKAHAFNLLICKLTVSSWFWNLCLNLLVFPQQVNTPEPQG